MKGITARLTPDMGNPYIHLFCVKPGVFGPMSSYMMIVNISVYRSYRGYTRKGLGYLQIAYVTGMPYFIAATAKFQHLIVYMGMCIA